jgi:hypothetical protein
MTYMYFYCENFVVCYSERYVISHRKSGEDIHRWSGDGDMVYSGLLIKCRPLDKVRGFYLMTQQQQLFATHQVQMQQWMALQQLMMAKHMQDSMLAVQNGQLMPPMPPMPVMLVIHVMPPVPVLSTPAAAPETRVRKTGGNRSGSTGSRWNRSGPYTNRSDSYPKTVPINSRAR